MEIAIPAVLGIFLVFLLIKGATHNSGWTCPKCKHKYADELTTWRLWANGNGEDGCAACAGWRVNDPAVTGYKPDHHE